MVPTTLNIQLDDALKNQRRCRRLTTKTPKYAVLDTAENWKGWFAFGGDAAGA